MTRRRTEAEIRASLEAGYATTVDRLTGDPDFELLKIAALREEAETPQWWIARNLLWLRIEQETPLFPRGSDQNEP